MKKTLFLILGLMLTATMMAQTNLYLGEWKTVDEKTGQPKAIVKIYRTSDGTFYGKILQLLEEDIPENPLCTACTGADRNKPIIGMITLRCLNHINKELVGGPNLDTEHGQVNNVKRLF